MFGQLAGVRAPPLRRFARRARRRRLSPTIEAVQSSIETHAEQVLAGVPDWLWNGETLPVPVEDIADSCFGLHVREVEDLRSAPGVPAGAGGLSGLLLPAQGEIWVSAAEAREWPGRRRFTISHELGHWCLHRRDGPVVCHAHSADPVEAQADEFAAALLMPAHLVRRQHELLRRTDDRFERLCAAFGASGEAMERRLKKVI